ncbi:trypsin-like serine protease [Kitasatospora aureofaciens]|uniref:trypsin-like serine protease n=1 Tax=Kitasatospora aureofaciens TaxID=1894 RepID=UPI0038188560
MRTVRRLAWPLGAALAIPVVAAPIPATAADSAPPSAVEGFSYPDAAKVLADRNITVKSSDGHIVLADCASGPGLVHVLSRAANPSEVCFKIIGPTGYLAVEIPKVYDIRGNDNSVKATLNTAGNVTSLDVPKNVWTPVGESVGEATTLLELTSLDGPAAPAPSGDLPAVGTVTVGQPGRSAGAKACTATLVDRYWVLTAASCFGDSPVAGAPATASTASIGGRTVAITALAPRADRDLVMARLAVPVNGVTPVTVGATAPAGGESLRVAGYGRTATEWTPFKVHTTTHTVGTVAATTVDTAPAAGQAPVCQGDAGAPLLRDKNGATEIAAVASRSWQGGCTGVTETRTGATSSRVDDLGAWVQQVGSAVANAVTPTGSAVYDPVKQTSTVFTVDGKGRVMGAYNINGQGWSSWSPISERPAGTKPFVGSPTVLYNPATAAIELSAIDSDGLMWRTYYMADAQGWRPWAGTGATRFAGGATAVYNPDTKTAEVFATTADGPVAHAYYNTGMTGWSDWTTINGDYRFDGAPSAVYNPATAGIELFAVGRDNTMYHTYWFNDGKPWSPWLPLNGGAFAGSPSLAYNPSTKTAEVFATTADGTVAHAYYTAGTSGWSSWTTINGDYRFASAPSAVYNPATDAIELFATGRDTFLYHAYWFNNGKPWSAWEALGNWKFSGRIPAPLFSASASTVDLFAAGTDGAVNHTSYKPGMTGWAPLDTLSGTTLLTS